MAGPSESLLGSSGHTWFPETIFLVTRPVVMRHLLMSHPLEDTCHLIGITCISMCVMALGCVPHVVIEVGRAHPPGPSLQARSQVGAAPRALSVYTPHTSSSPAMGGEHVGDLCHSSLQMRTSVAVAASLSWPVSEPGCEPSD